MDNTKKGGPAAIACRAALSHCIKTLDFIRPFFCLGIVNASIASALGCIETLHIWRTSIIKAEEYLALSQKVITFAPRNITERKMKSAYFYAYFYYFYFSNEVKREGCSKLKLEN